MRNILSIFLLVFPLLGIAQERIFRLDANLKSGDYEPNKLIVKFRKPKNTTLKTLPFKPDNIEYLKKIKGKSHPVFPRIQQEIQATGSKNKSSQASTDMEAFKQIYFLDFDKSISLEEAITTLLTDPQVVYAEPVFRNHVPLGYTPNDPNLSNAWHLNNIKAYDAWTVQKGDPSMVIGIVDFGFDVNHEDLKANIVGAYNIADNNITMGGSNPGHGTVGAGCMSAVPDNNIGTAGVAFNCKFMPIRGTSDFGGGFFGYEGLIYAVDNGCKVVNLSWGRMCGGYSQAEQDIINYAALVKDAVITVAAGNASAEVYWYPASYDHVISVAASRGDDYVGYWGGFNNFGCGGYLGGSSYNDKVDIMAPGQTIYSTIPNNGYAGGINGTSFASPMVAGAAALVRVQFPALNSQQIIHRLVATADDVYDTPVNQYYKGKIGSGRLNVFRALTDDLSKSVVLLSHQIKNPQNQPHFIPNQVNELLIDWKNIGLPLTNLQVKISSVSPFVTITDSTATLGNVGAGDTLGNDADAFKIFVKPEVPANVPIAFKVVFSDGIYTYTTYLTQLLNPDFLDINANKILSTATSKGRLAYNDDFNSQGKGFVFRPEDGNLLYESSLMMGISATQVSDVARVNNSVRNQRFSVVKPLTFSTANQADFSVSGVFTDTTANPGKLGAMVTQHVYAWKDDPNNGYFIQEYKIKNISNTIVPAWYVGLFNDWDVQGYDKNVADWDTSLNLGYVYNSTQNNVFAGVCLLTKQAPQYYALDYTFNSDVWVYDSFTDAEKFSTLSKGIFRTQSTPAALDVMQVIGAKIENFQPDQTQTVAFAFVAGKDLNELKTNALAAQNKFREIKTSALPTLVTQNICVGDSIKIAPANGKNFNFYRKNDDTVPVFTGAVFKAGKMTKDTVFYVSGSDSLYESNKVAVTVRKIVFEAGFITQTRFKPDTVILGLEDTTRFAATATGATKWLWNFGDGSTSDLTNPKHSYQNLGTYLVTLGTENAQGCRSTFTRTLTVIDFATTTEKPAQTLPLKIYPNPAQEEIHIENIREKSNFELINTLGKTVKNGVLEQKSEKIDV
ncbi:MAG: S8 family serine peptidase, partial [Verrucomicrobia bacterium]|nr:S8 family serine peptidase [Cytophagales bacterium]